MKVKLWNMAGSLSALCIGFSSTCIAQENLNIVIFEDSFEGCSTGAWNGGTTGTPVADSPNTIPRVSGLCGMELTAQGSVKDTSPVNEGTFIARFYMRGSLSSGTPVVFQAYSDDGSTTEVLTVTFDGSNLRFNGGTGDSAPVAVTSGWNLVELSWVANTGMDYWVNTESSEAPTGSTGAANSSIESVALGGITAFDGTLQFDDYVSHRETPIGGLLMGDANGSGSLQIADADALFNELDGTLSDGQPDCNLSGAVTIADVVCLFNAL